MLISFIIPVYNAENYLRACVNSLIPQTVSNYEIILIDDGSRDNSPELCDILAKENSRIRVYHKANGGAASARNLGVQVANGKYLIFIDADDFWRYNNYLEKLLEYIDNYPQCDFIHFNCSYFYDSTETFEDFVPYNHILARPVDKDTAIVALVSSGTMPIGPWKIIKRSYLVDNEIFFPEGTIMEDVPWFIDLLCKSNYSMFLNDYVYAYRREVPTSVTHSINIDGINNALSIIEKGVSQVERYDLLEESKNAILSFYAYEVCILMALYDKMQIEQKCRLNQLYWLLDYKKNPKVRLVSNIKHILGLKLTILVLRLYYRYREKR